MSDDVGSTHHESVTFSEAVETLEEIDDEISEVRDEKEWYKEQILDMPMDHEDRQQYINEHWDLCKELEQLIPRRNEWEQTVVSLSEETRKSWEGTDDE